MINNIRYKRFSNLSRHATLSNVSAIAHQWVIADLQQNSDGGSQITGGTYSLNNRSDRPVKCSEIFWPRTSASSAQADLDIRRLCVLGC